MKKFGLLFLLTAAMLALTGCPNNASTENGTTQPSSGGTIGGNTNIGTKISGLQANITVNAYMGDTQYNIQLNAEKGTFKAISLQPMIKPRPNQIIGRGDTDEEYDTITGSFVCNKTAAGDDLYWYAHNSAICLKPDTVTGSSSTDKSCYKIIADLTKISGINGTGTDNTVDVTNKYCTKNITSTEFTAAETAAKTAWDHSNDVTTVTFTEEQKTCLKAADNILKTCTKKGVSSLTQTFDADGNTNKDYTVGFSFNLGDTTCDVFIDKDEVAISTDESTDFSRSTPTWLMDAVKTVITSGASPDDIKNCTELKDCTALQTVITELASSVGSANDDVVYTEHGKDDYKAIPCPWSEDELANMKKFTDIYFTYEPAPTGAISRGYKKGYHKFYNDDPYKIDAKGKRTATEAIYLVGYGYVDPSSVHGNQFNTLGNEHIFGVKVKIKLEEAQKEVDKHIHNQYGTFQDNSERYYSIFTLEAVDASGDEYEATPEWYIDALSTFLSAAHTDYDRQYNVAGTGCPISDIGSIWIEDIYREYLRPGSVNGANLKQEFYADTYIRTGDTSTDTYEGPTTMSGSAIKALMNPSGKYNAYKSPVTTTQNMSAEKLEKWQLDFAYVYSDGQIDIDPNYEFSYTQKYRYKYTVYLFPVQ